MNASSFFVDFLCIFCVCIYVCIDLYRVNAKYFFLLHILWRSHCVALLCFLLVDFPSFLFRCILLRGFSFVLEEIIVADYSGQFGD